MTPNVNALNRAEQVRRDTDFQKNFSIGLMDIDETILNHIINNLKPEVIQDGIVKKVNCMFGSPELWKAMQKDSFIRDYNGKIQLPSIILKRTTSTDDEQLIHFNRYLNETVIRTHSPKNKYTKFSILNGKNAPVHEVYNITFPSHMKLTYHFVIWTEYVEQMNKLVELFQFNSKDYFGNKDGYKFRVDGISFGHTVELQSGDDRLIKTEFELSVHGYIIPETITKLDTHESTFKKILTPKKILMGMEIMGSEAFCRNENEDKWKNQQYPNKNLSEIIPSAPISFVDGVVDNSTIGSIITTMKNRICISSNTPPTPSIPPTQAYPYLRIVDKPQSENDAGQDGDVSYDDQYFYIYTVSQWRRVAISSFS